MKVIMYMAITANGMIAKTNHETSWSKAEWKSYLQMIRKTKNVIIGRKTFEIMKKENVFEEAGNPITIVLSKKTHQTNGRTIFVKTPSAALAELTKRKLKTALIAGGGKANAAFLKQNFVDEIYLDIEPVIFGQGISLFSKGNFEKKLDLIETRMLNQETIQLHYRVK